MVIVTFDGLMMMKNGQMMMKNKSDHHLIKIAQEVKGGRDLFSCSVSLTELLCRLVDLLVSYFRYGATQRLKYSTHLAAAQGVSLPCPVTTASITTSLGKNTQVLHRKPHEIRIHR